MESHVYLVGAYTRGCEDRYASSSHGANFEFGDGRASWQHDVCPHPIRALLISVGGFAFTLLTFRAPDKRQVRVSCGLPRRGPAKPGRDTARGFPGSAQRGGLLPARTGRGRTGLSLYLRSRWPTHEWAECGRSILGSTRDQQRTMRCVTGRQTGGWNEDGAATESLAPFCRSRSYQSCAYRGLFSHSCSCKPIMHC